jgi:hypothetical protein
MRKKAKGMKIVQRKDIYLCSSVSLEERQLGYVHLGA